VIFVIFVISLNTAKMCHHDEKIKKLGQKKNFITRYHAFNYLLWSLQ